MFVIFEMLRKRITHFKKNNLNDYVKMELLQIQSTE